MSLSGQQFKELHQALISAFIDKASLEQMLFFGLDKHLRQIVGEGSLSEIIFKLIQIAEAQGWIEDLVYAASESNPGNPYLIEVRKNIISNSKYPEIVELGLKNQVTINDLIEDAHSRRLTKLDISNQGIKEIPPEITKLINLVELDVSGNRLTQLPIEIGFLTNLKVFKLSGNRLNSLPKDFAGIQKLTVLDLSNNNFSVVPEEIITINNLTRLNLSGNSLTRLPNNIGNLFNLNILDISNNQLYELPVNFRNLNQLISLDISINKFDVFPIQISYCTNLQELIVCENFITDLSDDLSQLVYLTELDISKNQLYLLPKVITKLTSLKSLNLGENNLNDLPIDLVDLKKLVSINLQGNPLSKLPENFNRIIDPIGLFNYLEERVKTEEKPLREVKLIIVGEAAVGKTSVVNRLLYDSYNPNEDTTKGISITPWDIPINDINIRINIWDFGGQEIMHATHQLFLTKRSIYILVIDSRRGEYESCLEYWLKLIRIFGGDSPILIICNKTDQHQVDLDWTGLTKKYSIYAFVRIFSCKTGQGVEEVKKNLTEIIIQLKYINELRPAKWLAVKSILQKMKKDYISYEKYQDIAKTNGIKDPITQENLLRYLNDLGVILWFGEYQRLNNTNVLNPEWLTGAIYQILNSNLAFQYKGRIRINQLSNILDLKKYPIQQHSFIIDIMKQFELCFSFDNTPEETVLIPDLLQKDEPYTGSWDESLLFQIHYDVLSSNIISRFIVRMHHYSLQETYWRNGLLLEDKKNEVKALVKADLTERKIFIKVVGALNSRRIFLEIIRSNFAVIHTSISNLIASEWVPVPKTNAIVSYESLLINEQKGVERFVPADMDELVYVSELLNGVDPPEKRRKESYFGVRTFQIPTPLKLREPISDLIDKLILIPDVESFDSRTAFLLNIPDSDTLNRSTINAKTDISLLVEQLWQQGEHFSLEHPLYIFIDNAYQYVKNSELGLNLLSSRNRIQIVFKELKAEQTAKDDLIATLSKHKDDLMDIVQWQAQKPSIINNTAQAIQGGIMAGDRNINTSGGNYNENIEGDYVQGDKKDINQSRNFTVGNVGGDFKPTASPIMSDNAQINDTTANRDADKQPSNKKLDTGIIITVVGILLAICISGLFNPEVRQWLKLDQPSQKQEVPKNQ